MKNNFDMPTPEEIARRCNQIRADWTDDEVRRREQPKVLPVWIRKQERWAMISQRFVYFPGRHVSAW